MGEMAEFLLARFGEDEAAVRSAVEMREVWPYKTSTWFLAELDGKRRLVKRYRWYACSVDGDREVGYLEGLAFAMRLLAQPYARHPQFREEWAL